MDEQLSTVKEIDMIQQTPRILYKSKEIHIQIHYR